MVEDVTREMPNSLVAYKRRLRQEGNNFTTPTTNIISAKHLLDSIAASPEINKVKELLTAVTVQTIKLDPFPRYPNHEDELIASAPTMTEATTTAPTTGAPRRTIASLASGTKSSPTTSTTSIKKCDARECLHAILEERDAKYDSVQAFSDDIQKYMYLASFKPSGMDKYDGSVNPNLWLRHHSASIELRVGMTKPRSSTLPWPWRLRLSPSLKLSLTAPSEAGMPGRSSSTTSRVHHLAS